MELYVNVIIQSLAGVRRLPCQAILIQEAVDLSLSGHSVVRDGRDMSIYNLYFPSYQTVMKGRISYI